MNKLNAIEKAEWLVKNHNGVDTIVEVKLIKDLLLIIREVSNGNKLNNNNGQTNKRCRNKNT